MRIVPVIKPVEAWLFDDNWEAAPEWIKVEAKKSETGHGRIQRLEREGGTSPQVYVAQHKGTGPQLASIGDYVTYNADEDRLGVVSAEEYRQFSYRIEPDLDQAFEVFFEKAKAEFTEALELDDAGLVAEDYARRTMRPFLVWLDDCASRNVQVAHCAVAFAHVVGWMVYMVNRSTRKDEEFLPGLKNLVGLIEHEALAITSAEERDTKFVVEDLMLQDALSQPIVNPRKLDG